jgi:integrase
MNLENIRSNSHKLINHLEAEGYSYAYVAMYKKALTAIIMGPADGNWSDYESFYEWFSLNRNSSIRSKYRGVIAAIKAFDLYEKYPNGERLIRPKKYVLCEEFSKLTEYYIAHEIENGRLKPCTIMRNESSARSFLSTLQTAGIFKLNEITEDAILSAFTGDDGKLTKGVTYFYATKEMFRVCAEVFPTDRIIPLIPTITRHRKTIQYLTPEETAKIRAVLESDSAALSLRDKAIGIIAYYTGLRRSDIAGLNLDSIDLENDKIRIIQQKTGEPLELPLRPVVGNAIYDYVTLERPRSTAQALFLVRRNKRIQPQGLWGVSNKILQAAGVRQGPGHQRKGLHIFRFHLATTLLENEVSQPVISSSLGHADPASLETYLASDFVHLKACALSVERFPIAEGVLV